MKVSLNVMPWVHTIHNESISIYKMQALSLKILLKGLQLCPMYRLNVEQHYIHVASKFGRYNIETDGLVSAR